MTLVNDPNWAQLARAVVRGDFDDLALCHGCFGVLPREGEMDEPSPCPHCGRFDINDWEWVEEE